MHFSRTHHQVARHTYPSDLTDEGRVILEPCRLGTRIAMIQAGKVMERPLVGHRFRVAQSARQTDDGSLRIEYFAPPRANISEHVHPHQEESFEVISGTLGVRLGGRSLILKPGQSAIGPPGIPHTWWNPGEEEVCFLAGIRPGLEVEVMLETVLGLMREGKTVGPIPRNPLQLAVLAREIGSWAHPTGIPAPAQKALFAPVALLASVGKRLGYRAGYP